MIRFVPIQHGFYRVFWGRAYIHEVYAELPQFGHDIYEKDARWASQKFAEQQDNPGETVRNIKNYVEGYWDSIDTIRTRAWMMRNDSEFNKNSTERYRTLVVK